MTIAELHQLFKSSKGICTDTRKIEEGTIFFALKGANFNGNEYAQKALDEGCLWAVVDEQEYAEPEKCILVDDVLKTLQDLATHHRRQFDIPVLGITGSNGKTTSKELIGSVLSKKYNLLITEGNLNNHLGVPFTLLRMKAEHEFAVIEMGASKPGDIKELAEIAEPDYGIITNIGAAHIEGMGSLEGVARTKTELYRWIESVNGKIIINVEDDTLISYLPSVDIVQYGEANGDIQGNLVRLTPFVEFEWRTADYQSPLVKTNLIGRYNFTNFLAALAIGDHFGVSAEDMNAALEGYVPSNNRSQVQRSDRNTLIVDCYNANPTSMTAAINSLMEVDHDTKIAIVGDMLELGSISDEEHQKIADLLKVNGVNAILVGAEFQKVQTDFKVYGSYQDVIQKEKLSSIENSLILLKGSRGIKLENLIPEL